MTKTAFRFVGKGLSIVQPWASAIAFAGKDVENRNWRTHYRGPLAIHASGKFFREDLDRLVRVVRGGGKRTLHECIKRGRRRYGQLPEETPLQSHIIAIAMLTDCVERSGSPWFAREQWGWVLGGVVPIEPIPWTGGLSTWDCKFKYRPLSTT